MASGSKTTHLLDAIVEWSSEIEVEAESVVELVHEMEWNVADHCPDTFDCNGADLFGLRLGVDVVAALDRK